LCDVHRLQEEDQVFFDDDIENMTSGMSFEFF